MTANALPRRLLAGATALALLALCARGLLTRWLADDFAYAAFVASRGLAGAQIWGYRTDTGRFACTFLYTAFAALGPRWVIVLVPLTVAGLVAAVRRALPLPVALAIVYAIALGCMNVPQSVLWQGGIFTYFLPLLPLAWWSGKRLLAADARLADFAVPFVASAFSEVGGVCNVAALAVAVVAFRRKSCALALAGAGLAVAIVALAPGTAARRALFPPMAPPLALAASTLRATAWFLATSLAQSGAALVLVFVAAALFAPRASARLALAAALMAVAAALATFAAGFASISQIPPSRALVVPHAFLVAAVAALGAGVPHDERLRRPLVVALIVAAAGGPLLDAVMTLRALPARSRFARDCDALDAALRRARGADVVVTNAPGTVDMLLFLTHDPDRAPNPGIAAYYGLRSVAAAPPVAPPPPGAVVVRFGHALP